MIFGPEGRVLAEAEGWVGVAGLPTLGFVKRVNQKTPKLNTRKTSLVVRFISTLTYFS